MIPNNVKKNFETLQHAARKGQLCIMECNELDGRRVTVLCAVNTDGGEYEIVPLARMIEGNPYEELVPPDIEKVTHD